MNLASLSLMSNLERITPEKPLLCLRQPQTEEDAGSIQISTPKEKFACRFSGSYICIIEEELEADVLIGHGEASEERNGRLLKAWNPF